MGLGLIIPCSSGVIYSNQTGGILCLKEHLEGVFVPLQDQVLGDQQEKRLYEHFGVAGGRWRGPGTRGLPDDSADLVDAVLQMSGQTRWLSVDRSRLMESQEAWVWVSLPDDIAGATFALLERFPSGPAVLTWPNSD
jgi:hypothetical protein